MKGLQVSCAHGGLNSSSKTLHIMRHGITEMNEYLSTSPYGSRGFKDPLFFDTRLSKRGIQGARRAAEAVKKIQVQPELLVVSPLTRAVDTSILAWLPSVDCPITVEALARERVWLSADCGRHPAELAVHFKDHQGKFSFDHLDPIWWWHNDTHDPQHVSLEPEDLFKARVEDFRQWLMARPEEVIGIVSHWGLLEQLTGGADFDNCELRTYQLLGSGKLVEAARVR